MRTLRVAAVVFLFVALGSFPAVAASKPAVHDITGKVVSVHDGDTVTVLVGGRQHKIRLNGIDAPELSQDYGRRSRQLLASLCFGKIVRVRVVDIDRYGREVGDVFLGDSAVNAEMVRAGLAWHYKQYSTDPALAALEVDARAAKRGLWAAPHPTAPWDWRHTKSVKKKPRSGT
jgi:micrococcal nuclease